VKVTKGNDLSNTRLRETPGEEILENLLGEFVLEEIIYRPGKSYLNRWWFHEKRRFEIGRGSPGFDSGTPGWW
jgi:hypothetical protein